ncbi:MAG: glycogen synthase [Candidatus Nitronauta litoralis]|uniref:Glycogen synthase n=1 Tax=Candidatus Nitronauta litoralis TaxID=2705533 RepID=A0A7T0G0R9_9BACT|nr:MAG: glycogen synthase [Candidatus Nitronauta litoralis]
MGSPLNILIAASEVHPFAKTGGLADVCGALPKALKRLGHNVKVILPLYGCVNLSQYNLKQNSETVSVPVGPHKKEAVLFEGELAPGVSVIFVGRKEYFDREHLYGPPGKAYSDNAERFIFFSRALIETCKAIKFKPDIIHCNDWQTGLVPVYLKILYNYDSFFRKTRTIFSIHNLGYQGEFDRNNLPVANLPFSLFNPAEVESFGDFNFLKSALVYSDLLTTVSKTYSQEILTPEHSFRMEGILNSRKNELFGITNGIDYSEWGPEKDPWIAKHFSPTNPGGKLACKNALLEHYKLKADNSRPIVCMVTRLTPQKGIDLVIEAFEHSLLKDFLFVLIGSGDSRYEEYLRTHKGSQLGVYIGFDEPLAHRILAGSDFVLMPSIYEPCGLTQMQAMKYGTVPITSSVGGLKDTVQQYDIKTGEGLGFKFSPYGLEFFHQSVLEALGIFRDKKHWQQVVQNCLKADFGWDRSASEYERVYRIALTR